MRTVLTTAILMLLPGPATSQVLPEPLEVAAALHGPHGGPGQLVVHATRTGRILGQPSWGAQLRLLGIDFVGRTELGELLPDRPRWRGDVLGAGRLELPGANGWLYRYERQVGAELAFGFLWIGPDGRPSPRLERPGIAGVGDPFVARVGLDAAGETLLVATRALAGGDLLEVELRSGAVVDRTPTQPPLEFSDSGLWLADGFGFAVAADGVWRFDRGDGAPASPVPFPVGEDPAWFSGQAVTSPARSFAATTAGDGPLAQHVYVFGPTGPMRRATKTPGELSGAGFLPESLHGPYLAVADDGRLAAWRTEGVTREAHMAPVRAKPQPAVQISADAFFLDTLDELGQMGMFQIGVLTLAVGERSPAGAIEAVDFFAVRLDAAGAPLFQNMTLSSGDGAVPFLSPGTITPEVARVLPGGSLLVHDGDGNRILGVSAAGTAQVLSDVKEVYFAEPSSDHLLVGLRRESGNKPGALVRLPLDLGGPPLQLPGGGNDVEFRDALGDGSGQVAFVAVSPAGETLQRADLPGAAVESWPGGSAFAGALAFTRGGALLFGEGAPFGPVALHAWPVSSPPVLLAPAVGPAQIVR